MSDENGVVIHAEDEFCPDSVPMDPEAVAVAASDALRRVRTMAEQIAAIEAGETDWQKAISLQLERIETGMDLRLRRMEANLTSLITFCRGRTVTNNQAASVPPPPAGASCPEVK